MLAFVTALLSLSMTFAVAQPGQREELNADTSPWTAVGKLWLPGTGACTATLVGPDLILTNASCVVEDGHLIVGDYEFQGYLHGKKHYGSSKIKKIWIGGDPNKNRADDWAILRLSKPLGSKLGWMGATNADEETMLMAHEKVTIYQLSYNSEYKKGLFPVWQKDCRFSSPTSGYFRQDCAEKNDLPGSPLFYLKGSGPTDGRILAITSSGVDPIAIPASRFYNRLVEVKNKSANE